MLCCVGANSHFVISGLMESVRPSIELGDKKTTAIILRMQRAQCKNPSRGLPDFGDGTPERGGS